MLLDELSTYLQANGITNIFLAEMPDLPDTCVSIYEYSGSPPVFILGQSIPTYEQPRFQVVTRDKSYTAARTQAKTIYTLLSSVTDQVLSGTRYIAIQALQSPFGDPSGRDASNRARVLCNYEAKKDLS
jgi:hypothetical protein